MRTIQTVAATPAKGQPKVLLVEDDAAVRRSLQLLLCARGLDVKAYASGTALLADKFSREAQCIVMDYQMIDLDGLAVHAALVAEGWRGQAILITGYPEADLQTRAIAQGFDAVMTKPFHEYALGDMVLRLIGTHKTF